LDYNPNAKPNRNPNPNLSPNYFPDPLSNRTCSDQSRAFVVAVLLDTYKLVINHRSTKQK